MGNQGPTQKPAIAARAVLMPVGFARMRLDKTQRVLATIAEIKRNWAGVPPEPNMAADLKAMLPNAAYANAKATGLEIAFCLSEPTTLLNVCLAVCCMGEGWVMMSPNVDRDPLSIPITAVAIIISTRQQGSKAARRP